MFSASAVRRLSHIPGPVRASPRAATIHGGLVIERREGEVERWRGEEMLVSTHSNVLWDPISREANHGQSEIPFVCRVARVAE